MHQTHMPSRTHVKLEHESSGGKASTARCCRTPVLLQPTSAARWPDANKVGAEVPTREHESEIQKSWQGEAKGVGQGKSRLYDADLLWS